MVLLGLLRSIRPRCRLRIITDFWRLLWQVSHGICIFGELVPAYELQLVFGSEIRRYLGAFIIWKVMPETCGFYSGVLSSVHLVQFLLLICIRIAFLKHSGLHLVGNDSRRGCTRWSVFHGIGWAEIFKLILTSDAISRLSSIICVELVVRRLL